MNIGDFDAFITLAETLAAEYWEITEFKNLGGGVVLTVVPNLSLAEPLIKAGWEIVEFKRNGEGMTLTIIPQKPKTAEAE
jgi:hypothetical protein